MSAAMLMTGAPSSTNWAEEVANLEEILRQLTPMQRRHYDVAGIRGELLPAMRKLAQS